MDSEKILSEGNEKIRQDATWIMLEEDCNFEGKMS
jgi:hypothetical protein